MSSITPDPLDLDFISDAGLRKTIKEAIEYIVALLGIPLTSEMSSLYIEETHRVIILYVASIIEAIFLHCFKEKKQVLHYLDYKFISTLPSEYNYVGQQGLVVVALQKQVPRLDHQLGLHDLVNFFKDKKLIKSETAADILEINNIRNTVHLSKPRTKRCDIDKVEFAFNTLVHIIKNSPKLLT